MRAISIGAVKFDIPDWLDARDDDGTLVAYPPETDYGNLRVSVSTIATEDGKPSLGAGERIVRSNAAKEQRQLHKENSEVWYSYSQAALDGSPGSTITFWHVGVGAHTAVLSCFIDSAEGDAVTKQRVMDVVVPLIRSLRADDTTG
jgi:plastocyanin